MILNITVSGDKNIHLVYFFVRFLIFRKFSADFVYFYEIAFLASFLSVWGIVASAFTPGENFDGGVMAKRKTIKTKGKKWARRMKYCKLLIL